ncbi:MAG: hypothetical protein J1F05_02720 [Muribaculaceae bacterium]|nr:hypothetical protein [Muribaculaceae bacterium]
MRLKFFLLLIAATALSGYGRADRIERPLLDSLYAALNKLEANQAQRGDEIEELKQRRQVLPLGSARIHLGDELGLMYIVENLDSAAVYYNLARHDAEELGDEVEKLRLTLHLLPMMPLVGITKEAIDWFEEIDYTTLPDTLRHAYWLSGAEVYYLTQRLYPQSRLKGEYVDLTLVAVDSLLSYYPVDSPVYQHLVGRKHLINGEVNLAVANFVEVLPRMNSNPELADFAYEAIINYYSDKPEFRQAYITYLLRRVTSSLNRGLVRSEPLARLGKELIDEGYRRLGRRCIALALTTPDLSYTGYFADFDRSTYAQYITNDNDGTARTNIIFHVFVVLIFIAVCVSAISSARKLSRLKREQKELYDKEKYMENELARTKQSVISLAFLALEQLRDYSVHVLRKLKAGQANDLLQEVETGSYMQQQTDKYFEEFDSTFLSSFPDFVDKLNKLLQPDKQMTLLPDERLSPELRIAAFMRLGVNDSARLSQIMALSLNTIYTYRNRLRGRALNRDSFEADLLRI